jgi:hypothetical protein
MMTAAGIFASLSLLVGLKGTNTGEFYMTQALADAKATIDACLKLPECSSGVADKLQQLHDNNVTELPLRFTNSELPLGMDFRTQNQPQTPVVVNLSSLWWEDKETVVAFDLEQSIELWARIWGYQLGWARTDVHDVGARLSWFVGGKVLKTVSNENSYYSLVRFKDDGAKLFIEDDRTNLQAVTVDADLAAFSCQEVNKSQGPLKDLKITDAIWLRGSFNTEPKVMSVIGTMNYRCGREEFESEFTIKLPLFEGKPGQWHFVADRVEKTHSVIRRISPNTPDPSSLMF